MKELKNMALSMLDLVSVREGGTVADALAIALRTVAGNRFNAAPAATPPRAPRRKDRRSFDMDQIPLFNFGIDQMKGDLRRSFREA